jgi:hypothetical protein
VQPQRRVNRQGIPPHNPTHYAVYRKGAPKPVFTYSVYRWGQEVALRLANQCCADLNTGGASCPHANGDGLKISGCCFTQRSIVAFGMTTPFGP